MAGSYAASRRRTTAHWRGRLLGAAAIAMATVVPAAPGRTDSDATVLHRLRASLGPGRDPSS
ncbi:MAG TPA: hypothetical protein VKU85_03795, partial [bacterium]|nr:hypothetical protein [bacterium]